MKKNTKSAQRVKSTVRRATKRNVKQTEKAFRHTIKLTAKNAWEKKKAHEAALLMLAAGQGETADVA